MVETLLSQVQELQQLHQLVVAAVEHIITNLEKQEAVAVADQGVPAAVQELQIKVLLAETVQVV
jgi:hypothetical protein